MAKHPGNVGDRGLGLELRHYRQESGLTLEKVGILLGWSANTVSRLERGLRPETTAEVVSAILAITGVTGENRDRLMRMARGYREQGLWEDNSAQLTDQARTYIKFERRATRITDIEPMLVPGLLQTPEYYRALLKVIGYPDDDIEMKIIRRVGRQALLHRPQPPEFNFVVSELMLRQPLGGPDVMARQVRRLCEDAERPKIAIRVIPIDLVAHLILHGAFVLLDFDEEPPVVYVEGRMSGLFPENPKEIESYMLTVKRLMSVAPNERESLTLLRSIAEDLEGAR